MHKRRAVRRRGRRRTEEQAAEVMPAPASTQAARQSERLGPLYNAGPVHELAPGAANGPAEPEPDPRLAGQAASTSTGQREQALARLSSGAMAAQNQADRGPTPRSAQELLPALEGKGTPERVVAFNRRGPLRLQGRTDATYDGGQYHTENVTVRPGRGSRRLR